MSQIQRGLQALRIALNERLPRIRRGCCTQNVLVGPISASSFSVRVDWDTGSFTQVFFASEIFSYNGPKGTRLKKTACRYADDIINGVLKARGVL